MRQAQLNAAHGMVFDVPGVVNGSSRIRFLGRLPTGNVAVKKQADPDSFGPLTVSPEKAAPLMDAIARRFPSK